MPTASPQSISPTGLDFQINSTGTGNQSEAAITALSGGRFVVTWTDKSLQDDTSGFGVRGRLFAADGSALGPDFQINSTIRFDQVTPSVTALSGGGFVVTWCDNNDSYTTGQSAFTQLATPNISARVFDPQGAPVGRDFSVNSIGIDGAFVPKVSALADGGFIITWHAFAIDVSGTGILARIFRADGASNQSDFAVNSTTLGPQTFPSVTILSNGTMVMAWQDALSDGSGSSIRARLFNRDGFPEDDDFLVNSTPQGDQAGPTLTALSGGGFVVTWLDNSQTDDTAGFGIRARVFGPDGSAIGNDFQVNSIHPYSQMYPSVTALPTGGFIITWHDYRGDGSGTCIRARLFNESGIASGSEIQINSTLAGNQTGPTVTTLSNGTFVIAWQDAQADGSGTGIRARIFVTDNLVLGDGRDDVLSAGPGQDTLDGGAGNDTLTGGSGNNLLLGGDGNDTLSGGAGNDTLDGGNNNDVAIFSGARSDYLIIRSIDPGTGNEGFTVLDTRSGSPDGQDRLYNIETLTFSDGSINASSLPWDNETLSGTDQGEALRGSGGNDSLSGGAGDDFLHGGNGNDTLDGGAGNDTLEGGNGDSLLLGQDGNDYLYEQAGGNDTFCGGAGDDTLWEWEGSNSLTGDAGNDLVLGGDGQDSLSGGAGNDTLDGGNDYDTAIYNGARSDYLITGFTDPGTGNEGFTVLDTRSGSLDGQDRLYGIETLTFRDGSIETSSLGQTQVNGGAGDDSLAGGPGPDDLRGLGGNDTLCGGAGNDTLDGGTGNDIAMFSGVRSDYRLTLLDGIVTVTDLRPGGPEGQDVLTNVETLKFRDQSVQTSTLTAPAQFVNLVFAAGGMSYAADSGDDTLVGGKGNDDLSGQGGADRLVGGAGDDVLTGGGGDDQLDGGPGRDTAVFSGARANYAISVAGGSVTVSDLRAGSPDGTDQLTNIENFQFSDQTAQLVQISISSSEMDATGGLGDDTLLGYGMDDTLFGADGNDSLAGGDGHDELNGNQGNDTVSGGSGDDWVLGGKDNDLVDGGTGNDIVYGNLGNDTALGGEGADTVRGGQGDDSVSGGAGDDWLWGDRGSDTISGGAGADSFHSFVGAGLDRITDFNRTEGDRLILDGSPPYTISQVGADTVVDLGHGDQVVLAGLTYASLDAGWIVGG